MQAQDSAAEQDVFAAHSTRSCGHRHRPARPAGLSGAGRRCLLLTWAACSRSALCLFTCAKFCPPGLPFALVRPGSAFHPASRVSDDNSAPHRQAAEEPVELVEVDGRRRRRFSLRRGGPAAPRTDVLSRADRTGSAVDALKGSGPRPTPTCYPDPMPVSRTPSDAWSGRGRVEKQRLRSRPRDSIAARCDRG